MVTSREKVLLHPDCDSSSGRDSIAEAESQVVTNHRGHW